MTHSFYYYDDDEDWVGKYENQKNTMISRSETVVDEGTVVIKFVDAAITNRAVETGFRLYNFIVNA